MAAKVSLYENYRTELPQAGIVRTREQMATKMKVILYVIPQLRRGGGEKQFILLLKNLDRTRFLPIVACLENLSEYTQEMSEMNIPVHYIHGGKLTIIARLLILIKRHNASIVHTWLNNEWGRISAILYQALYSKDLAIISSERDEMQFSSRRFRKFFIFLGRVLSFFSSKVTFNSPKALAFWEGGLFKAGVGTFIGNGIEESEINDRPHIQTSPPLKIAVVARLVIQKNIPFLFRSIATYPRKNMLTVSLIGDGPLKGELEALAANLNILDQVTFVGKRSDIPEILRQHDIGMLCSQSEGFSNSVLEYLANGLAIVATDAGANACCIDQNGFLVSSESDIHNAWNTYLDNPCLLPIHQIKSVDLSKNFAISKIVDQYQKLYDGGDRALRRS